MHGIELEEPKDMQVRVHTRWTAAAIGWVSALMCTFVLAPNASADNKRLNDSVVSGVHIIQYRAGCVNNITVNPKLRLAAQWHTEDILSHRELNGDIGSDGGSVADRAHNAGYEGSVSETIAISPALAISPLELINQWYYRADYYATMSDCSNVEMGVWSENSLDRTVVVAVYGKA